VFEAVLLGFRGLPERAHAGVQRALAGGLVEKEHGAHLLSREERREGFGGARREASDGEAEALGECAAGDEGDVARVGDDSNCPERTAGGQRALEQVLEGTPHARGVAERAALGDRDVQHVGVGGRGRADPRRERSQALDVPICVFGKRGFAALRRGLVNHHAPLAFGELHVHTHVQVVLARVRGVHRGGRVGFWRTSRVNTVGPATPPSPDMGAAAAALAALFWLVTLYIVRRARHVARGRKKRGGVSVRRPAPTPRLPDVRAPSPAPAAAPDLLSDESLVLQLLNAVRGGQRFDVEVV